MDQTGETGDQTRLLEIDFTKTCDCADNHINCLTAKEWLKSQIGVWQFYYEDRDNRDKDVHPATYPIALSTRCIELFTKKQRRTRTGSVCGQRNDARFC